MFNRVLIANRGEIALRVVRCCHEIGLETVCVYSEADRDTLAVRLADHAVCIGPAASVRSYLHVPSIIQAALLTGADAIHPGAGFLAEDPRFAEVCERYGITFIGTPSRILRAVGEKTAAKDRMREAGVPVIPGSAAAEMSLASAIKTADDIGYPIMLKPAGGGGGKGMRVARNPLEFERFFPLCQSEALSSFGNGGIYLERFFENMRHIEVQIAADTHGHAVSIGERNCSAQRFHQKLAEEAPSALLTEQARAALFTSALNGAQAIGFLGVGTFEFLVDWEGRHYFLEINKRIQVEHPVTEAIYGIDLVKEQIRIADGMDLSFQQVDLVPRGHALECRINAEDPNQGFQAQAGRVSRYVPPGGPGMRVDSHMYSGYIVPPFYDSLLAKFVAWGATRDEALARMARSLDEAVLEGLVTNISFQRWLIGTPEFVAGKVTTEFVGNAVANGAYVQADVESEPPS